MTSSTRREAIALLAQCDLLGLLSEPLRPGGGGPGSAGGLAALREGELDVLLERSGLATGDASSPPLSEREADIGGLYDLLLRTVSAFRDLPPARWRDEHTQLFETAGFCPPNETFFIRRDKGAILADVAAFSSAFGFEVASDLGEKSDHIVAELELLGLLLVKLARALDRGDDDAAQVTRDAVHAFMRDHLGDWLPLFCERLAATAQTGAYRDLARSLATIWDLMVGWHGLHIDTPLEVAMPPEDGGSPYECGLIDSPDASARSMASDSFQGRLPR